MKLKFDVDCTPEEARAFFGLPDVKPMQDALLKQAENQMAAAMHAMEPEQMMSLWMPAGMQGFEQLQKFWSNLGAQAMRSSGKS